MSEIVLLSLTVLEGVREGVSVIVGVRVSEIDELAVPVPEGDTAALTD